MTHCTISASCLPVECHQLNGINRLPHTPTPPPFSAASAGEGATERTKSRKRTSSDFASPSPKTSYVVPRTPGVKCLLRPFVPIFKNPHLLTIAGNFWPRTLDLTRFPVHANLYETEPGVQILVHSQHPAVDQRAQLILVHGLEGSSDAGYARSLAQAALEAGYAVHRFNMRSCGGTEALSGKTLYHSGQTCDVLAVAKALRKLDNTPIYLIGFSLGGNVVLKLAGELGDQAQEVIDGVCAVSTPIDLAACVRRLHQRSNFIYAQRFLKHLKKRVALKERLTPGLFDLGRLKSIKTIYDFDDVYTARSFGFGSADNYYATQSAERFIGCIRTPALLVQAKDDPLVPFEIYSHPAFSQNPHLQLIAPDHGGHLGYISKRKPRLWLDGVLLEWLQLTGNKVEQPLVP
jgi:predicted alpha/beta-fold hydrolase